VTRDHPTPFRPDDLVDAEAEIVRLSKELAAARDELGKVEAQLANRGFTDKAPAAVVAAKREQGERLAALCRGLAYSLGKLQARD